MDITKRERIGIVAFGSIILLVVSIMYFKGDSKSAVQVIKKDPEVVMATNMQDHSSVDVANNTTVGNASNDATTDLNGSGGKSGSLNRNDSVKAAVIKVCILGEIKNPGVYTLCEGDRIEQVVNMAGGFTSKAQVKNINLAKKIKDEDMITIPNINDKTNTENKIEAESGIISNTSTVNSTGTAEQTSGSVKININTATKEQLKELPRIGDAIAQRIIDYREQAGNFKRIENIMDVSGIGTKMFENLKDKITVE